MVDTEVITFSEAARRLGVGRGTISDIAAKRKIRPKRKRGGKGAYFAKCLNADDLRVIREALGLGEPEPAAAP